MKRFLIPLLILFCILLASLAGVIWWNQITKPVSDDKTPIRFVVSRGKGASQIANSLFEKGLIKNPLAFKIYVQATGKADKVNAGEFKLSKSMSLYEIVKALQGKPTELWVTIPEGLRREEIVDKFIKGLELEEPQSSTFRGEFLAESENLEGYLFPDTYLFAREASASAAVKKLKTTFDSKMTPDLKDNIVKSGYNLNEIVVLASLIERETKTDEERPVVAGILLKRVEAGWPLQVDAAVQYAVANKNCKLKIENCSNWWPFLTKEDLEINSSYNTYKFKGLPPTPIANPGFASIKAAINPQESSYWFYIHDGDGKIHYAETIQEHNANINNYLGK